MALAVAVEHLRGHQGGADFITPVKVFAELSARRPVRCYVNNGFGGLGSSRRVGHPPLCLFTPHATHLKKSFKFEPSLFRQQWLPQIA